jgi:hypothetical protein
MTAVEVLAPIRLETRFLPPDHRADGVNEWQLRLRVYPDEFSIRRMRPPTADELDRLTEAINWMAGTPPVEEADAFAAFASAVGAGRALRLWRAHVLSDAGGRLTVDRAGAGDHVPFDVHGPAGLPATLEVWLIYSDGTRRHAATLTLNAAAIGDDLNLRRLVDDGSLAPDRLPETWWLSHARAVEVGLAMDIDVGPDPPELDALVVLGIGDGEAADLVDAHNATGRMAILPPGTSTNTIAGEPTTDCGERAETVYPLLHADPTAQPATSAVLAALTGRVAADALPMLGGELDYFGHGSLAVQGFWPVLWGRHMRDVTGAGDREIDLARWAIRHLAVEGPRPAFRVGEQPYGLLPTTAFAAWVDDPGDDPNLTAIESRIREWGLAWRAGAAAASRAERARVHGQDVNGLLRVFGLHAPSRYWAVRPTADLHQLQALRLAMGAPLLDSRWESQTADALRGVPWPLAPLGRAPGRGAIPGPPRDEYEDPDVLRRLVAMQPEELYRSGEFRLGLVGHLFRETLVAARAITGEAYKRLAAGAPVTLGHPLPWDDQSAYASHLWDGGDIQIAELETGPDANGRILAMRFREVREALLVIADLWETMARPLFRATLAALDTSAFRVDPWLTGIAERRLQRMIATGAPFRLGAYGWVDAPAPFTKAAGGPLAPGPTAAGLLHAPSSAQAVTAALLRDAAVRHPGSDQWRLTIDSAKVRAAAALAERVRLGLHPYEALGYEVEHVAGDWDVVRQLRQEYPLAPDQQERRVCDGQKVLQAARDGILDADLAARLAPLDQVLDTYADLLIVDGVHSLVSGRADLANAAMEAASGLGAPPDLRAIRTPRRASTVHVGAWVLLPSASVPGSIDPDPVWVADPAYAAAIEAELGAGALYAGDPPGVAARERFVAALGGAEDEAPLATLIGGGYEGLLDTAHDELRHAIAADLEVRRSRLASLAQRAHDELVVLDPDNAASGGVVEAVAGRWSVDLTGLQADDPSAGGPTVAERRGAVVEALAKRLAAAGTGASDARRAIRTLAGRSDLPVLPIVPRALLPVLRANGELDRGWLEIVAAVRPRLASLEARQLDPTRPSWPAAVAAPDSSLDPWHATGPVVVAYGPGITADGSNVALAVLDAWSDSVPARRHVTTAAFGFNAPKSRAPQAVLVAVPPDRARRLDNATLLDVVLETRELAHARAAPQIPGPSLPYATPMARVAAWPNLSFLEGWPT